MSKLNLMIMTILGFLLSSCISGNKESNLTLKPAQLRYENEEQALTQWQKLLDKKDFLTVSNEISQSLDNYESSKHWHAVMFTLGLAKEGLEDWSGALQVYQKIVDRSIDRQWEFVALATHRRAYCYEVMLDNEKALASLMDAARLKSYLPLELTLAEIPARLASVYARLNQTQLADNYTQKAEKGIQKLRAIKRNSDPEIISRTLVKMGGLSLTQIDESSFQQNLVTLMRNQRFLIQAIELHHPQWSREGEKILLSTYTNLWKFIENYKVIPSDDWQMDLVQEAEKKSEFLSFYLEAIEKLKNYESPPESQAFVRTAVVYNQIKNIETRALALLNDELLKKPWDLSPERMPSSESFMQNSQKQSVQMQSQSVGVKKHSLEFEDRWDLGSSSLPKKKAQK